MRRTVLIASIASVAPAAALASPIPTAVFTNIQSSPTSDVPGLPGIKFNPGATTQFDRPAVSPNGQLWVTRAVTNLPAAENDIILAGRVGSNSPAAAVILREGTPTFFDAGVLWGLIGSEMSVNDDGSVAFSADTTAATGEDQVIARFDPPSSFTLIAREGMQAVGQPLGIGYGSLTNAPRILNDGAVIFRSSGFTGDTSQAAIFRNTAPDNGVVLAQTDITVPANQAFAPDQTIDFITSNRLVASADGSQFAYSGDLNGPTNSDLFMALNNTLVGQEDALISTEFSSIILGFHTDAGSQQMAPNGRFVFRGNNEDQQDWVVDATGGVVRVLTATDRPITLRPGETEFFDDAPYASTFFLNAVNDAGDRVIGGTTNAPDDAANAVLVFNDHRVVAREGDGVDIDGNGLLDDNAFITIFNNDDAFLTADGWFYFNADLRDADFVVIGQAFIRVHICKADWDVSGAPNSSDISAYLTSWLGAVSGGC